MFMTVCRLCCGFISIVAHQLEHIGHMLHIRVANALRLLIVFEIEVAIRKAESALIGDGDNAFALFEILAGAKIEDSRTRRCDEDEPALPADQPCFSCC